MKNPLPGLLNDVIESIPRVKKLHAVVEKTEDRRNEERRRNESLRQQNQHLTNLLALKEGRAIFDHAQHQLQIGLTKELEQILLAMRERVAVEFIGRRDLSSPDCERILDFRLTIPPINLRFCHRVDIRDVGTYHQIR